MIDAKQGKSLQEVYEWLSAKFKQEDKLTSLEQGYREMASDEKREQETFEWSEGTLNDY